MKRAPVVVALAGAAAFSLTACTPIPPAVLTSGPLVASCTPHGRMTASITFTNNTTHKEHVVNWKVSLISNNQEEMDEVGVTPPSPKAIRAGHTRTLPFTIKLLSAPASCRVIGGMFENH